MMNMLKNLSLVSALLISASGAAWAQESGTEEKKAKIATEKDLGLVVATVDGEEVTLGDVLVKKHYSAASNDYSNDPENDLVSIVRELGVMRQLAEDVPSQTLIDLTVKHHTRAVKTQFAYDNYLKEHYSDKYLKKYWKEWSEKFSDNYEFNASHIVVMTEEEAMAVKKRLDDGEAFEDVAREVSIDESAQNGGDLGWFRDSDYRPVVAYALTKIKKGEVTEPIDDRPDGWYIAKLHDFRNLGRPSFEEMKDELEYGAQNNLREELKRNTLESLDIQMVEGFDASKINMRLFP